MSYLLKGFNMSIRIWKKRAAGYCLALALGIVPHVYGASVPENSHTTSYGKGWQCNSGYLERSNSCISVSQATDVEIKRLLIQASIGSYSGSCPCPYNTDRGGRRCGGRSAYSRPGGAEPLCYESDVSDWQVENFRARYE